MKHKIRMLKKCIWYSFSIVAGFSTFAGVWGYTVKDIFPKWQWWKCGLIIIILFIVLSMIVFLFFDVLKHKRCSIKINGKTVEIKSGDIFSETGWKVIPFNDRFDTQVDDKKIAHNTLNGKMIDSHVDDLNDLMNIISLAADEPSDLKPKTYRGKTIYPLGRIIAYQDFLMLSFSHFDDQNQAYIEIGEYEQMLIRMWSEIRRVYAAKHIVIPLIGTGITTIRGMVEKNYTEMLKCILCTLRRSGFQPEQGISIILTKDAIEKVDLDIIKEDF